VTLTCPGSSETRTGKVGSVTATVIASTVAQGQANALSAAQAKANRVAGERARAACSTPAVASGIATKR